jgi:LPS-assembly lipoprotein
MSWFRSIAFALALLGAMLSLGSCGFRPLYGAGEPGSASAMFASIEVAEIPGRIGYELRNSLIDRLSPEGSAPDLRYLLDARLDTSKRALAIQQDETTTRFNLALDVNFMLLDRTSNEAVYRDSVRIETSFNVLEDNYATLVSELDAEKRAARQASEEIRTLLAVFFARQVGG